MSTPGQPPPSSTNKYGHVPVLLNEVISHLLDASVQSETGIALTGRFADATYGRGGHSRALLARLGEGARLLALDRDDEACAVSAAHSREDSRVTAAKASFAELDAMLTKYNFKPVHGIMMDLGISSPQVDDASRGFSFNQEGDLDMRMDRAQPMNAADWLNEASEQEIADVIYKYGEERASRRVARQIVAARPLRTTTDLAEAVLKAVPYTPGRKGAKAKHPATRTFQAVRMFVNRELEQIEVGLQQAFDALAVGGRLAVITFHSIEDRTVKQKFKALSQPPALPRRLPVQAQAYTPPGRLIGRAIRPSDAEVQQNPRARSATLRVVERVVEHVPERDAS